jgi:hypothetical protein
MSKIEVPDEMDEDEAEKILEQRAKARSGSKKKPKVSTRNKAGGSDTSLAEIVAILVLIVCLFIAVHLGFF